MPAVRGPEEFYRKYLFPLACDRDGEMPASQPSEAIRTRSLVSMRQLFGNDLLAGSVRTIGTRMHAEWRGFTQIGPKWIGYRESSLVARGLS